MRWDPSRHLRNLNGGAQGRQGDPNEARGPKGARQSGGAGGQTPINDGVSALELVDHQGGPGVPQEVEVAVPPA